MGRVILMIDDNPNDCELVREAMLEAGSPHVLACVCGAAEGEDYLRRRGAFADAPEPALVLLDINLGATNGHDLLRALKADPVLRRFPVVMYSTSGRAADIATSLAHGAEQHLVKPADWTGMLAMVGALDRLCAREGA